MRLNERERKQSERTGWPRVIACIGPDECSVRIKSTGPGDRLCEKCRAKNGLEGTGKFVLGEDGEVRLGLRVRQEGKREPKRRCETHDKPNPCPTCSVAWKRRRDRWKKGIYFTAEELSRQRSEKMKESWRTRKIKPKVAA